MSESGADKKYSNSARVVKAGDGFTVYYYGRPLYDKSSPRASAERRTLSLTPSEHTCYIIASPLLYYGARKLCEKLPETSMICAVELTPELAAITVDNVPPDTLRTIPFVTAASAAEASEAVASMLPGNIRRIELVRPNGGYRIARPEYEQLHGVLQNEISSHWRNVATLVHFGRRWMRNIFRNLHRATYTPPCRLQMPVVVCAAGESLERHLDSLRRHREQLHIVAVDTALGPLRESNIVPDSVVAIESQVINVGDFLAGLPESTRLFFDLTTHPSVPGLTHSERRHFLLTSFAPLEVLERIHTAFPEIIRLRPFASVGLAAVNLACRLSTGPVALAGFDFAYTPGKPHARGSLSHRLSLARDRRLSTPLLYEHAMTRHFRTGRTSGGESYTTESSLVQQSSILAKAVPAGRSICMLTRTGPEVPLEEKTLETFLSYYAQRHSQAHSAGNTPAADRPPSLPVSRAQAASFFSDECRRLRRVKSHGEIGGMEYLWMDFADQTPDLLRRTHSGSVQMPASLSQFDKSLRARVLHRAESFLRFIETVTQSEYGS